MAALLTLVLLAWTNGNAPWCRVDNYGNGTCYWFTRSACEAGKVPGDICLPNQADGGRRYKRGPHHNPEGAEDAVRSPYAALPHTPIRTGQARAVLDLEHSTAPLHRRIPTGQPAVLGD